MIFKLQDRPLAVQIWIILGIILGGFFALSTLIFPVVLSHSFTKETYARLEDAQIYFIKYQSEDFIKGKKNLFFVFFKKKEKFDHPPPFRVVKHIFFDLKGDIEYNIGMEKISSDFINEVKTDIKKQDLKTHRYNKKFNNKRYFYVIRKVDLPEEKGYLVSYLRQDYRDNLVKLTFIRLIGTIIIVLSISLIASIFIARYLTRPLTQLQTKVKGIAQKKWNNPVGLERNDEIGQLAETIDWMRKQLFEQNRKQQEFLQQVSHELKTPVMVIKSYIQSVRDGIFPKGNLEASLDTIDEEALQLEKRVRSLLNLTKLDYFSFQRVDRKPVNLAEILKKKAEIFSWRRSELNWKLELEPLIVEIDRGKFSVAVENIFDNQNRYADKRVEINLEKQDTTVGSSVLLHIWNDGPYITPEVMDDLFKKYKKGTDGDFGLGLALAKVIVNLHQGKIWAVNEEGGVSFYIRLPFKT